MKRRTPEPFARHPFKERIGRAAPLPEKLRNARRHDLERKLVREMLRAEGEAGRAGARATEAYQSAAAARKNLERLALELGLPGFVGLPVEDLQNPPVSDVYPWAEVWLPQRGMRIGDIGNAIGSMGEHALSEFVSAVISRLAEVPDYTARLGRRVHYMVRVSAPNSVDGFTLHYGVSETEMATSNTERLALAILNGIRPGLVAELRALQVKMRARRR